MLDLGILELEFENTIVVFNWNERHQIWFITVFCERIKMSKSEIKTALFGYFWTGILQAYFGIWNHHPRIYKSWVFQFQFQFMHWIFV